MPVALCTFTTASETFNLGTEDCYVTASKEPGRTVYRVQSHYVDREGNRFFIDGETRGRAELYVAQLAASLEVRPLIEVEGPEETLYVPDTVAIPGTLANPYTELIVEGCFCTGVEHQDEGGRLYGIIFTFEKPDTDPSQVPADSIVQYKGIDLGNLPGFITPQVGAHFQRYEVTCSYRGTDYSEYPTALAAEIGMLPFTEQIVTRADLGTLGVIKSWNAVPGVLSWAVQGFSEEGLYIESIGISRQASGLISLQCMFVKGR